MFFSVCFQVLSKLISDKEFFALAGWLGWNTVLFTTRLRVQSLVSENTGETNPYFSLTWMSSLFHFLSWKKKSINISSSEDLKNLSHKKSTFKKILFIYFWERGEGRKKHRERNINVWLPLTCAPHWGPGPQPRHVSWLGIEPVTLWFPGWHSIQWVTSTRAKNCTF